MKLLLDTHIWIWTSDSRGRLEENVALALGDPANELWLSPISAWELGILVRKRRIVLSKDSVAWVRESIAKFPYREALVTHQVALATHDLDLLTNDPADRILAATAIVYGLTLVTADEHLLQSKQFATLANR